jgi:hypothetical protein
LSEEVVDRQVRARKEALEQIALFVFLNVKIDYLFSYAVFYDPLANTLLHSLTRRCFFVHASGLEIWNGKPCAQKYFRQRLWTAASMATQFVSDRECWAQHMALDPMTGSDFDDIHIRAAQGFEAADYFMGNYW